MTSHEQQRREHVHRARHRHAERAAKTRQRRHGERADADGDQRCAAGRAGSRSARCRGTGRTPEDDRGWMPSTQGSGSSIELAGTRYGMSKLKRSQKAAIQRQTGRAARRARTTRSRAHASRRPGCGGEARPAHVDPDRHQRRAARCVPTEDRSLHHGAWLRPSERAAAQTTITRVADQRGARDGRVPCSTMRW